MKPKIAIIGSGISGLSCAYFLRNQFDITIFEANHYLGGHTNTVTVREGLSNIPVDTGFMVYNDYTYPNLIKLFKELEINSYDTSMSFGVQNLHAGIEMAFSGLNTLFAQRINFLNPRFYKLISDIKCFFKDANSYIKQDIDHYPTLGDFISDKNYCKDLEDYFLLPMISAIWSTPSASMLQYPARSLFHFMKNHGLLGIGTQFIWKTVEGGSKLMDIIFALCAFGLGFMSWKTYREQV